MQDATDVQTRIQYIRLVLHKVLGNSTYQRWCVGQTPRYRFQLTDKRSDRCTIHLNAVDKNSTWYTVLTNDGIQVERLDIIPGLICLMDKVGRHVNMGPCTADHTCNETHALAVIKLSTPMRIYSHQNGACHHQYMPQSICTAVSKHLSGVEWFPTVLKALIVLR